MIAMLVLFGGPFGILLSAVVLSSARFIVRRAFQASTWLKVYSMKSETKDLILKDGLQAVRLRGMRTLHPDLSGIEDFQSLRTRGKELMGAVKRAADRQRRAPISTVFGDVQVTTA